MDEYEFEFEGEGKVGVGGRGACQSVTILNCGSDGECGGRPSKQNRASKSVSKHAPVTVTVTAVTADVSAATLGTSEYLKRELRSRVAKEAGE